MAIVLQSRLPQSSRAMLVIAHPDDETMFFTPTIQALKTQGCSVVILCLSTGNHSGLGSVRGKELLAACCILGIEQGHIVMVDHPELQDGPQCWWPSELVASIISKEAEKRNIEMIITFDVKGVSGHPNHVAVWRGTVAYLSGISHSKQTRTRALIFINPGVYFASIAALLTSYYR
ncbi:N-acetylglucosaminyl-phosphatidylinositol de-N-acetylase, variant 2 [Trebouxia sp. C0009 RCD-2024]